MIEQCSVLKCKKGVHMDRFETYAKYCCDYCRKNTIERLEKNRHDQHGFDLWFVNLYVNTLKNYGGKND